MCLFFILTVCDLQFNVWGGMLVLPSSLFLRLLTVKKGSFRAAEGSRIHSDYSGFVSLLHFHHFCSFTLQSSEANYMFITLFLSTRLSMKDSPFHVSGCQVKGPELGFSPKLELHSALICSTIGSCYPLCSRSS